MSKDSEGSDVPAPGLKVRPNRDGSLRAYWYASPKAAEAGYTPRIVPILDRDPAGVAARCQILQAQMLAWLAERTGAKKPIDPTLAHLFRQYRTRPESPFHAVKWNTRRIYAQVLGALEEAVGDVKLREIDMAAFRCWYDKARWPDGKGKGKPELTRKAHGFISLLRRTISFGVAAEVPGCARLNAILAEMRFEQPRQRKVAMEIEHVLAFLPTSLQAGRLSLALGTALQFECAFRQKDVIGEWAPVPVEGPESAYVLNNRQWQNGLTWADVSDDLILIKRTTKTGAIVSWDLKACPMTLDLISKIPADKRFGPLIVDERAGRPYAENVYAREWRAVATAAGVPIGIRNMDARAGAATEADAAGAGIGIIRPAMGHADERTTVRYVRGGGLEHTRAVATLRVAHRAKENKR